MSTVTAALSRRIFSRPTKRDALQRLAGCGFTPATCFDVGAQVGTPDVYEAFPDAHHILIEPVQENEGALRGWRDRLKSAEVHIAGVSDHDGTMGLTVSSDTRYAQLREVGTRQVKTWTLDTLAKDRAGPFFVKIDVDGAEMAVLAGAQTLMRPDSAFIIETTFLDRGARFKPVIDAMYGSGFVVSDIVDAVYRKTDGALWQVDLLFLHASSPLMKPGEYS